MGITRRDFLNGFALAVGAGLTPWQQLYAQSGKSKDYYPPALTGMRGNHPGSNRYSHPIAFGSLKIDVDSLPVTETYDLLVVGAGISGLAAAWFYRKKYPNARILIIDNHDDFGGHAKRNEMGSGENFRITYGGSESLDSPVAHFSDKVNELLQDLGVDYHKFEQYFQQELYANHGMTEGMYFDADNFGRNYVTKGDPYIGDAEPAEAIASWPLSDEDKAALNILFNNPPNYFPDKQPEEIKAELSRISYDDFLKIYVKLSDTARSVFRAYSCDFWGYNIDGYSALDGYEDGYPGFSGMPLSDEGEEEEPYIYHFPDGNASIARLLVRAMIPNVAPGNTMEDIVLAPFDYSKLDLPENNIRLRLNTTAAAVRNHDGGVDLAYIRTDNREKIRVRAKHCVMACYYRMMPPLLNEMDNTQRQAIDMNVKIPYLYSKVLIKNWQAFKKLGVHRVYCPTAPYTIVKLDFPVSMGGYNCPTEPEQAIVVHLVRALCPYGTNSTVREMAKLGRKAIYRATYEELEQEIIDQLNGILSPVGERIEPLIEAITINRWSHGYSYEPKALFDSQNDIEQIQVTARQALGHIHLANSDAGWSAYLHVGIDQAARAIEEIG